MRGGKRPGAGRPKGTPNPDTVARRALVAKATAQGITPLEVMLQTMREAWDAAQNPKLDAEAQLAHKLAAVETAHKAAPYVHPRLAQIESKSEVEITRSTVSPEPMPADEWERTYGRSAH